MPAPHVVLAALERLQRLERARPVRSQQPGQTTIRKKLSHRSGIAHSSWFRCPRSECAESFRHTSGKALHSVHGPPCPCETRSPFRESPASASARSRSIQSLSVSRVAANSLSHSCGCSLCVRVIGDSWAACRISSEYALPIPLRMRGSVRALLSVRFSTVSAVAKRVEIAREDVDSSRIHGTQGLLASENRQRCAVLGAGFGEHERASGKIEGRQTLAASQLCLRQAASAAGRQSSSAAPARDRLPLQSRCACRFAAVRAPRVPPHLVTGRLHGAKQKRARQPHSLDRLPDDAWFKRGDVGGDVRQFRHA